MIHMREGTMITAGIVLTALAAALAAAPAAAAVDPGNGAEIYEEECWYCHGEEGRGMGLWGQPNFTQEELWLDNSEEHLVSIVRDGGEVMPGFEDNITDEEVHDVLAYSSREFADVDYADIGSDAGSGGTDSTTTPEGTDAAAESSDGEGAEATEGGTGSEDGAPGFTALAAVAAALSALVARRRL